MKMSDVDATFVRAFDAHGPGRQLGHVWELMFRAVEIGHLDEQGIEETLANGFDFTTDELLFDPWGAQNKVAVRFVDDEDEVDRHELENALRTLQLELRRIRGDRVDTSFREVDGVLYDDPPMSAQAKASIRILDETESAAVWDELVSPNRRHFMLLADESWPSRLVADSEVFFTWEADWNANEWEPFARKLALLGIPDDAEVFVLWMREIAAATRWDTFRRNWTNFLHEDEGVLVVSRALSTALILRNGRSWYGSRPLGE